MQANYLHVPDWAMSVSGRPIALYRKIHTEAEKPRSSRETARGVVFVGGVHGDEPEGIRLAQDLLAWISSLSPSEASKLREWILIPCLNIDGASFQRRVNASGVDLNRNFPSTDWSREATKPRYSPGPKPASEPETRALSTLLIAEKPELIVHFHSWHPCIVYTGAPGKAAAEILGEGTGYEIREDIGYPTPGSLGQYGWNDLKTPVICIEAEAGEGPDRLWPRFGPGLRKLLQSADSKTGAA